MRVFAIKDESLSSAQVLGYLIYYETPKAFYIELPDGADPWDTPLLLDSFVRRGEHSVGSYWSRIWVDQRIVPQDRQNIGQVLRENGLAEYDEFSLLMLSHGRCAQDDCYLEELPEDVLPAELIERWKYKIEDMVPLDDARLLTFFRIGQVRIIDTGDAFRSTIAYAAVDSSPFSYSAGHGKCSGSCMYCRASALSPINCSILYICHLRRYSSV